jgi:hypothetical protein
MTMSLLAPVRVPAALVPPQAEECCPPAEIEAVVRGLETHWRAAVEAAMSPSTDSYPATALLWAAE